MISAPPGAPPWVAAFAQTIERALQAVSRPSGPEKVYAVADAQALNALCPPKTNVECQVFVRDIARLAVSDGTKWMRMDTGATL